MGAQVSVKSKLQVLSQTDNAQYQRILNRLKSKSNHMQISKWELVMLLELNPAQIKEVVYLTSVNHDVSHVKTHNLIVLIILSRVGEMSCEQKIQNILDLVCFQSGVTQQSEVQYVLNVICEIYFILTHQQLQTNEIQAQLFSKFFDNQDVEPTYVISQFLSEIPVVQAFFQIFEEQQEQVQHRISENFEQSQITEMQVQSDLIEAHNNKRTLSNQNLDQVVQETNQQIYTQHVVKQSLIQTYSDKKNTPSYALDEKVQQRVKKVLGGERSSQRESDLRNALKNLKVFRHANAEILSVNMFVGLMDSQKAKDDSQNIETNWRHFQEFFKSKVAQLAFQIKTNESKLLYLMTQRGKKRIWQVKRMKCLGEINNLKNLQSELAKINQSELQNAGPQDSAQGHKLSRQDQANFDLNQGNTELILNKFIQDFKNIRQCGMTKKALVTVIELKNQKIQSQRTLSFFTGVQQCLVEAEQISKRAWQEFSQYIQHHLEVQTQVEQQIIQQYEDFKHNILQYQFCVGKLKAYQSFFKNNSQEQIQKRINLLQQRCEIADNQIISCEAASVNKRRIQTLIMKSKGMLACYKIITKNIPFQQIHAALVRDLARLKVWELIIVSCSNLHCTKIDETVSNQELQECTFVVQRISELDQETKENFKDTCLQISEEERLASEAPQVPFITPLEDVHHLKNLAVVVKESLSNYYQRYQVDSVWLEDFNRFVDQNLLQATCDLQGNLTYQQTPDKLSMEDAGQLLFNFCEIEQNPDDFGFFDWLSSVSLSLKFTYFHASVEKLKKDKSQAHSKCKGVIDQFTSSNFQSQKLVWFQDFLKKLKLANKGQRINNFKLSYMSMPLDYSLQNNYWLIQALQIYFNANEREAQFKIFKAQRNKILLSERSPVVQMSIHTEQNETNMDESTAEERDKQDFNNQFRLCKGLDISEQKVKLDLFTVPLEVLEAIHQQNQIKNGVLQQVIQQRENITCKQDIEQILCDMMLEDDQKQILDNYKKSREQYIQETRKISLHGVFKGAIYFLNTLIENYQTQEVQPSNMTILKEYLMQIYERINSEYEKGVYKINELQQILKGLNLTLQSTDFVSIFVKKQPVITEAQKKEVKKIIQKGIKGKGKQKKQPQYIQSQNDVINHLIRLYYVDQCLIDLSKNSDQFILQAESNFLQNQNNSKELEQVIAYLNINTLSLTKSPYVCVYEEEQGCRIMQQVQSESLNNPVYVHKIKLKAATDQSESTHTHFNQLNDYQVASNQLLQFLNEICRLDDELCCKQIIKNDRINSALNIYHVMLKNELRSLQVQQSVFQGIQDYFNVYQLQSSDYYLKRYQKTLKQLGKLFKMIEISEEGVLRYFILNIVSTHSSQIISKVVSKIDSFFNLADFDMKDKLDYQTASVNIKRDRDQMLRTFKENVALEENWEMSKKRTSLLSHQETMLEKQIASLHLITLLYYFKL